MSFYHDVMTKKSWELLKRLRKGCDFILIGGWAVFLYTRSLKSKDIDLVVEYDQLEKLKQEFEVVKNDRLRKYEAKKEEVEIDIYVPYYSSPGLPAEELRNYLREIEGFKSVRIEVLAILKQAALLSRPDSLKGKKDLVDLFSLFTLPDFDWLKFRGLVTKHNLNECLLPIRELIEKTSRIDELGLSVHQMAKTKRKILRGLFLPAF